MGGGTPSAKFDVIGRTWRGTIIWISEPYPVTDMKTKAPKFFPSGDPIKGFKFDIQTDQRDADIPDDDGKRRIYVESQRMMSALRIALKNAGAPGLRVGGKVAIQYASEEATGGANKAKVYAAAYEPPVAAASDLLGVTQPAPAPAPALSPSIVYPSTTAAQPVQPVTHQPVAVTQPVAQPVAQPVDAAAHAAAFANLPPELQAQIAAQLTSNTAKAS